MEHGKRKTYVHAKCRCSECVAANACYMDLYREVNREQILDAEKRRYQRNKDRIIENVRDYYQRENAAILEKRASPWGKRAKARSQANRRAKELKAFVESVDPKKIWERDGGVCGICEKPVYDGASLDHVIPLSRGGLHQYANVQLAHKCCNEKKKSRKPTRAEVQRVERLAYPGLA